jgi:2-hydroxy-3-oxopropionate reductase
MRVGVIGLGAMGSGIAKNLIQKGFSVFVRDIRPKIVDKFIKKGASTANSSRELGILCDAVLTSLPMSPVEPALENEILGPEGLLEGMPAHRIIIDCGNTSPLTSRKIFQECQKRACHFWMLRLAVGQRERKQEPYLSWSGALPTHLSKQNLSLMRLVKR